MEVREGAQPPRDRGPQSAAGLRRRAAAGPLALAVLAALCVRGAGMDTIRGLHAARAVTSFAPGRAGSVKLKGRQSIDKIKAQAFKIARHGKRPTKTSMLFLRKMARRPENATLMEKGCENMARICMNANEQAALSRKGACAAVVVTLKKHRGSAPVVLAALRLATNLCYAQPRNPFGFAGWAHTHAQDELGRKQSGIADIVKAMTNHTASAEVQDAGVRALANLVYNNTDNVLRCVRDKGLEAVIAGMEAHPTDIKVQEGGCLFVWSVLASIHNESYITYGLEMTGAPGAGSVDVDLSVAGRLAELGAVPVVMSALKTFGCVTEMEVEGYNVGEQGCAALWFLSVQPGRLRTSIMEAGAVSLAEKVLRAQNDILPARSWAARLLEQLTGSDYSEFVMPIQVPGPDARAKALKEVKECVWECPYYCGCNGTWGINRPAPGLKKSKAKAKSPAPTSTGMPAPFKAASSAAALKQMEMEEEESSISSTSNPLDMEFSDEQLEGEAAAAAAGRIGRGEGEGQISYHTSDDEDVGFVNRAIAHSDKLSRETKFMAKVWLFCMFYIFVLF